MLTKYNVTIFGEDIDNRTLTVDAPTVTIDNLPAVDSDVNVFITAMNVFVSTDPSAVAMDTISELCTYVYTYHCVRASITDVS